MNRIVLQIGKKDFESFLALKNCLVVNGKELKKHEDHYKKTIHADFLGKENV